MKTKTRVRAGGIRLQNHNETLVKAARHGPQGEDQSEGRLADLEPQRNTAAGHASEALVKAVGSVPRPGASLNRGGAPLLTRSCRNSGVPHLSNPEMREPNEDHEEWKCALKPTSARAK